MLSDNSPMKEAASLKECKPDYEQMIAYEKKRLELNTNFQNAILSTWEIPD